MTAFEIQQFELDDYEEVVSLWKEAGLVPRPGDDLESIRLKSQKDPELFLLARESGVIVGCVLGGWDGRRGWIYHLAVKPSRQRQGIAKTLIQELESRLIRKGAKKVNAQIYSSNSASLRFFRSCEYETHQDLVMVGKNLAD